MLTITAACIALALSAAPMDPASVKKSPLVEEVESDITGYYACDGKEGPNKHYSGVAVISRRGDTFIVQWLVGVGSGFTGVATRNGNTLSAAWALQTEKGIVRGINTYTIHGKTLTGRWTALPGDGSIRSETLTFLRALPAMPKEE